MWFITSMAVSVPLAEANGKEAFYYVKRQLLYGTLSFFIIIFLSIYLLKRIENFFDWISSINSGSFCLTLFRYRSW